MRHGETIDSYMYSKTELRIIQALQQSGGFNKFFQRYYSSSLEINSKNDANNYYYSIYIVAPKLRPEYNRSHKTLIDKILDFFIPTNIISKMSEPNIFLMYDETGLETPEYVERTSYRNIMRKVRNKILEQQEIEQEKKEKQALKNELGIK